MEEREQHFDPQAHMQQLHTAAKDGSSKHGGMHCGYYYVASPDEEKEIKHCNQSETEMLRNHYFPFRCYFLSQKVFFCR